MDEPDEEEEEEMIDNKFNFWPIGQGLFYTGNIDGGQYNFVYDCGSSTFVAGGKEALRESVKCYLDTLKDKSIDFMVVSHLDADHVNGIFDLMNRTRIAKLYLPYLGNPHNNAELIKLTIAKALIDDGGSDEETQNRYRILTELYRLNEGQDNKRQERKIEYIKFIGGENGQANEQVKGLKFPFWEFKMFSKEIPQAVFDKLNDEIAKELKGRTIEELFLQWSDSSDPVATKLKNVARLRKIYKDIVEYSDVNSSSIVLVHYPICMPKEFYFSGYCCGLNNKKRHKYCFDHCIENCCCFEDYCCRARPKEPNITPVTILTGDAEFDYNMLRTLADIKHEQGGGFGILQAPHHGSRKNWESLRYSKENFDIYVIPFGYGNTFGHPSYEIENDLRQWNKTKIWATQFSGFSYRIDMPRR